LETLDLSSSRSLQSIPDSLGNLANLSYLNLEDCRKLKSFPVDALLKLTKLVYLNGRGCAMDAFPQLTWLQISSCGIDQLPEWFASLTTLRTLELCSLKNLDVI
ncbi:hypothetical protein SELMODRAFT_48879, partial [Selaginella moellendorffii]